MLVSHKLNCVLFIYNGQHSFRINFKQCFAKKGVLSSVCGFIINTSWLLGCSRVLLFAAIKDQQTCGSCWTFPATALLEFAIQTTTREKIPLSEQVKEYFLVLQTVYSSSISIQCNGNITPTLGVELSTT